MSIAVYFKDNCMDVLRAVVCSSCQEYRIYVDVEGRIGQLKHTLLMHNDPVTLNDQFLIKVITEWMSHFLAEN